jgi:hypothetical protein
MLTRIRRLHQVRDTSQVADEPSQTTIANTHLISIVLSTATFTPCQLRKFITATMMSRVLLFLALVVLSANVRLAWL